MTDELALGMSELAMLLLTGGDVDGSLSEVADVVARMLPDRPMVGVVLARGNRTRVGESAGAQVVPAGAAEGTCGSAPSLLAISTTQQVSITNVADEQRWNDYPAQMLEYGVKSIFAQPFSIDGEVVGALTLYSPHTDGITDHTQQATTMTAEHIGVLMAVAFDAARQTTLTEQLRAAIASRSLIDQALGIIMGRHRCNRTAAFDRLRRLSQWRNVKVNALAVEIIESVSGEKPERPHFAEPGAAERKN